MTNSHFDPRDCKDIGYLTAPLDYNGEIPDYTINGDNVKTYAIYMNASGYAPAYVLANSYDDNEFLGWYDGNANLLSTSNALEEREISEMPKGTSVFAKFSERQNTSDERYTIKISSRSNMVGSPGFIGFESGKLQRADQEIVVDDGTMVTIYAEGNMGNDDSDFGEEPWWYYIKGFYENNIALKTFNDINKVTAQYTFTARSNRTIYVDFIYYKR